MSRTSVWRELDLGQEAVSSILLVMNARQENSLRDQFVEIMKRNIEPEKGVDVTKRKLKSAARLKTANFDLRRRLASPRQSELKASSDVNVPTRSTRSNAARALRRHGR